MNDMKKTTMCDNCKGTGRVLADIPFFAVPDCNNCSFTDICKECGGRGYIIEYYDREELDVKK